MIPLQTLILSVAPTPAAQIFLTLTIMFLGVIMWNSRTIKDIENPEHSLIKT